MNLLEIRDHSDQMYTRLRCPVVSRVKYGDSAHLIALHSRLALVQYECTMEK